MRESKASNQLAAVLSGGNDGSVDSDSSKSYNGIKARTNDMSSILKERNTSDNGDTVSNLSVSTHERNEISKESKQLNDNENQQNEDEDAIRNFVFDVNKKKHDENTISLDDDDDEEEDVNDLYLNNADDDKVKINGSVQRLANQKDSDVNESQEKKNEAIASKEIVGNRLENDKILIETGSNENDAEDIVLVKVSTSSEVIEVEARNTNQAVTMNGVKQNEMEIDDKIEDNQTSENQNKSNENKKHTDQNEPQKQMEARTEAPNNKKRKISLSSGEEDLAPPAKS